LFRIHPCATAEVGRMRRDWCRLIGGEYV
jgi:hypothetical protein